MSSCRSCLLSLRCKGKSRDIRIVIAAHLRHLFPCGAQATAGLLKHPNFTHSPFHHLLAKTTNRHPHPLQSIALVLAADTERSGRCYACAETASARCGARPPAALVSGVKGTAAQHDFDFAQLPHIGTWLAARVLLSSHRWPAGHQRGNYQRVQDGRTAW